MGSENFGYWRSQWCQWNEDWRVNWESDVIWSSITEKKRKENRSTEKKSIALKATTNDSDSSSEDDEETVLMTNQFRRFLKYRRKAYNKANSNLNDGRCFNCN